MSPPSCACHVFETADGIHVYDVGTNEVYAVDEALGAVIAAGDDAAALGRARERFGAERFDAALAELAAARASEGVFGSTWPAIVHPPFDKGGDFDGPDHLTLSVTEQCNFRCRYCPHTAGRADERPHTDVRMPPETALAALGLLRRRDPDGPPPTISFYGGEPLLELPLLRQVVRAAADLPGAERPRFVIDTNGALLDAEVAEFVAAEGIWLQISLDGPAEVHDRHRRRHDGEPSHAAVLEGIRTVLRHEPGAAARMTFMATLTPPYPFLQVAEYFADFPPFLEAGVGFPPRARIALAELEGLESGWPEDATERRRAARRGLVAAEVAYVKACRDGRRDEAPPALLQFFDDGLIRFHHRLRGPVPAGLVPGGCCRVGRRKLHVRADGTLQPCERLGTACTVGRVDPGVDPARVACLEREFHEALGDRCARCWAVRMCRLCFVAVARARDDESGQGVAIPETACAAQREQAARTLRLHATLGADGGRALAFLRDSTLI